MKIIFRQITETDLVKTEFKVKAVKYSDSIIAIDIEGMGWITLTKEQYHTFDIVEED